MAPGEGNRVGERQPRDNFKTVMMVECVPCLPQKGEGGQILVKDVMGES